MARTSWVISGRAWPDAARAPSSDGAGAPAPSAIRPIASTSASIAARRTSCRYRLLLPTSRARKARVAHTVAGVELAVGLEHRDAPCRRAELDRPVQRRRPAVAPRARVHDQAAMLRPDRLRDHRLEHRADDQLRAVLVHGRLHRGGRVDDGDRHLVAQLGQRDPRALAEAVVSRYEEEHPQRPPRVARVAAPDLAPHRSEPTAVTLILLTAPNQPSHCPQSDRVDVPKTPPRTALLPVKQRTGRIDVAISASRA